MSRVADALLGTLLATALLAVNVGAVSARLGFLHKPKQVKEYDHWRYLEMSRGAQGRPELQQEPPYCFRIAVPTLARGLTRLGLSENAAFFVVTNASLLGFLLLLWLHLRDLGFGTALRATALLVVGFTQGAVRWFEYQYWMTDPAGLFLVMLAFYLIERRRVGWLWVTSLLGALVRESYLLVYPYFLLHEWRRRREASAAGGVAAGATTRDSRPLAAATLQAVALAAAPLAVMAAVRLLVRPNQPDSLVAGVVDSMGFRWRHRLDNQAYVLTVGSLGVLVPLLLLFPARLPALLRRHFDRALFVLSVCATLAISNNNERPLAYALPALVPAGLWCLRRFLAETRLAAAPVLAAVVALQVLFWAGQRFAESGMSIYQPVNRTTLVAMVAAWAAAQLALRLRRAPA